VVTLSPRRTKLDPGRLQAGFVVHEVISRVFRYCPINIVRSKLLTHPHLQRNPYQKGYRQNLGAFQTKRNFSLISSKAQQITVIALFAYKTTFFAAPSATCQGAHRPTICMWLSKFRACTISSQNCVGNQQQSHKS